MESNRKVKLLVSELFRGEKGASKGHIGRLGQWRLDPGRG